MAAICRSLADTAHTLAASQSGGGSQDRGLRPAVEGERRTSRQAIGNGGRRLGFVLYGSGNQAAAGRLSPKVSQYTQNAEGSTS